MYIFILLFLVRFNDNMKKRRKLGIFHKNPIDNQTFLVYNIIVEFRETENEGSGENDRRKRKRIP